MRALNLAAPAGLLAAVMLVSGCNEIPISGLEKSFSVHVRQLAGSGDAIPIDFLWVVDNSASMCEEQVALGDNFSEFTRILGNNFDLDPRVAVVTMDMQCDPNLADVRASKGAFNHIVARDFPPSCQAQATRPCTSDQNCASLKLDCDLFGECGGTDDKWRCRKAQSVMCVENPNGTVNTTCIRGCTTDQECIDLFGDDRYKCNKPSGAQSDWGCILPPSTSACPAEVGPVLDGSTIDQFGCLATVGVNQLKCFEYEQGMRSALTSLDKNGVNKAFLQCTKEQEDNGQCKRFLRDEAYLVIIFVSDEDDCSADSDIDEGLHEVCGLQADQNSGGPLVPVNAYVNRFKSLKSDPARVIIASIAGDALADVPLEPKRDPDTGDLTACGDLVAEMEAGTISNVDATRACYEESKLNPFVCFQTTKICASPSGQADWGSRYAQLSARMGDNGVFENICSPEGLGPALEKIANRIVQVVSEICLPKGINDVATLLVSKTVVNAAGQAVVDPATGQPQTISLSRVETFTPGEKNVYRLKETGAQGCQDESGFIRPSIVFPDDDLPRAGEEILITYAAKPELSTATVGQSDVTP